MNALCSMFSLLFGLSSLAYSPPDADNLVCSPQSTFRIPIDLSASERQGLSSIRLFVSHDHGSTWVRHSDGDSAMDVVTFRAKEDGEYWFTIALVDQAGVQIPADVQQVEPGLKVLVDTRKPDLQVKAIRNRAGRRGIRWVFDDPNIVTSSYRLAVFDDQTRQWREYDIRHPEEKMVWFGENESFSKFQATVRDRAQNVRVIEMEVVGEQFSRKDVAEFALVDRPMPEVVPVRAEMPADESSHAGDRVEPAVARSPLPAERQGAVVPAEGRAPVPPVPAQTMAETSEPPATFCSSNHVVVNYVVDASTGGRPVAELWGTRDGGQRWSLLGVDEDGRSPIEAKLPAEGRWGLRIVVREGAEPTAGPETGSAPEMAIEVDATPPAVDLAPPTAVDGRVVVRWRASDPNLDPQPIDILYSATPRGPWRPVATGLKNVGEYVWDVAGAGAPPEVYIRVEARDQARHVGSSQSTAPVRLLNPSR